MGILQISSRIGAAAAPWVAKGLKGVSQYAPFLVMGVSSLIAVFSMIILPETKGTKTAEVVEDVTGQAHEMNVQYVKDPIDANSKVNMGYSNSDELTHL